MGSEMVPHQQGLMATMQDGMAETLSRVNLIQSLLSTVMVEDMHYGVIPGTKKKSLLKPGAEKIAMTFRLRPIMTPGTDVIVTDLGGGHREVLVYCHILSADGVELATGIGSCSTMEAKYRWRGGEKTSTGRPVPAEYWNLRKDGKLADAQALLGGREFGVGKFDGKWEIAVVGDKQENPDIADTYNTVLKMAKKRAYIDGVLSATAASDIFTQDLEEEELHGRESGDPPPVRQPQRRSVQQPEPQQAPPPDTFAGSFDDEAGDVVEPAVSGVLIEGITEKKGTNAKTGKPWVMYQIAAGGQRYSTFDLKLAEAAEEARATGAHVNISYTLTPDGKYRNLTGITHA